MQAFGCCRIYFHDLLIHELFSSHTYEEGLRDVRAVVETRQRKSLNISALGSEDRS